MLWRVRGSHHFRSTLALQVCRTVVRQVSQSAASRSVDPSKTRNFALVAHIDSGKTTLTESILTTSGYLSAAGTVDTGSTTTDFLPAERERGITIQSASIPVSWKDWSFNLIDTPGHADFGMEVESASRVVDGAVVLIDAVEGVESQTQGVWRQLDRYNVKSRILFLNKMDRPGASFRSSLTSVLNYRLHPRPLALTVPVASFESRAYTDAEPGIEGIVDLVHWQVWKSDCNGTYKSQGLPVDSKELETCSMLPSDPPLLRHLLRARSDLLESLSMYSEELMEKVLKLPSEPSGHLSIGAMDILSPLRTAVLRNDVLPVLCGSAMKHMGTSLVLDYVGQLFPSPADGIAADVTETSDVQILAWKVAWDKRKGWMTFVRVYSGALTRQTALFNITRNQREKISKLLLLYANEPEEVDCLPFGSVGVILGLKHTRTGDTLVSAAYSGRAQPRAGDTSALRDISLPPAVMSAAILPQSSSDLQPVQDALLALSRTDPSARVETDEGQLLVHGLGSLHLEIVEGRLRDEWGVNFIAGRRRVSYREGFGGEDTKLDAEWATEAHGKKIVVQLSIRVRGLGETEKGDPSWDENVVVDGEGVPIRSPDKEHDSRSPWTYISQGVASVLSTSPHFSLPLSRIRVQIIDFTLPDGASVSLLAGATSSTLRSVFLNAPHGPVMEPYIRLTVVVSEDHFGRVMKDIIESSGELTDSDTHTDNEGEDATPYSKDGIYIPPDWLSPSATTLSGTSLNGSGQKRTILAVAPLSKMLDFSNRLRALSGGHGTFEMSNGGFRAVPDARKLEILKEIGRA